MRLRTLTGLLILVLVSLATTTGMAATLSVPADAPTIGGAMRKARAGDIILVSCGTYHESHIRVKPGVSLWSGTLQPSCVTIDAREEGPVFIFADADTNTTLVGLTLTGGRADAGGAVQILSGAPRFSNCIFTGNQATKGGAMLVAAGSRPLLKNCLFRGNRALQSGGAMLCAGHLALQECAFEGNSALLGGALCLSAGSELHISGNSFVNNEAGNSGGGLHCAGTRATIRHTVFAGNLGGLGGAALSLQDTPLEMESCTLVGQGADAEGAVLAARGPAPSLVNTIIAFSAVEILPPGGPLPSLRGCNLWANHGGDWTRDLQPLANRDQNFSRDPQFCAPEKGHYTLKETSSCLPRHNPSGNKVLVGALGAGCDARGQPRAQAGSRGSGFRAVGPAF